MKILEFGEGHKLVIQEAQQTPEDKNKTIPIHIIIKVLKIKDIGEKREGS